MTKVFSPDWLESLKKRYAARPAFERPALYRIAFDIKCSSRRAEIEQLIEIVDSAHQAEVIQRLRDKNLHRHMYHELVVGGFLNRQGHKVNYEKKFAGDLTPDWFARGKQGIPRHPEVHCRSVEVFTADLSDDVVKIKKQLGDLCGRINCHPGNSQVQIIVPKAKVDLLNPKTNKKIAKDIADWLSIQGRAVGDSTSVDGVTARVFLVNSTPVRIRAIAGSRAFWVGLEKLQQNIAEKIGKYKDLRLTIVIAVVPHFESGLEFEEVKAILDRSSRLSDGKRDSLSAVLWAWPSSSEWRFKTALNQSASLSLPKSAFANDPADS